MIQIKTDPLWSTVFVGLFFAMFAARLEGFNLSWWLVTSPLYGPPVVTLVWALFQWGFYKSAEMGEWD
jgi:hypothetical protein